MGQYHLVANIDKREFIHPHRFGDGLKLLEFGCSAEGTMTGLAVLLAASNGRGGGDLNTDDTAPEFAEFVGRWVGDRLAIIGDYFEEGDVPRLTHADMHVLWCDEADEECQPFHTATNTTWRDVSYEVAQAMAGDHYLRHSLERTRDWTHPHGGEVNPLGGPVVKEAVSS